MRRRLLVALFVAVTAIGARAQVDCDTPDDLCTGDPCVVGSLEVGDPCVLDFGPRTLVLAGTLRVPTSGELSLTAGALELTGRVQNVGGGAPAPGPRIALEAAGDVYMRGPIRLVGIRGVALPGSVTVRAGGALVAANGLTAATSPTTIVYEANGDLTLTGRVNTTKAGGALTLTAAGAVTVTGALRRQEDVQITAGGDVTLGGRPTPKSSFVVDAGGTVVLESRLRALGADVALRGATGVLARQAIVLTPLFLDAGSLVLASSAGPVETQRPVDAIDIALQAAGALVTGARVSASPPARSGGTILLEGASVTVNGELRAQSGDGTQPGDGAGGHVQIVGDTVDAFASILVNAFPGRAGAPGGTVQVNATADVRLFGPLIDADGDTPGPDFPGAPPAGLRVTAGDDIDIQSTVHARGGPSVVQLTAAGDLTAVGEYRVAPNGCFGLSAGGTLVDGTNSDTPPVATCP